MGTDASLGGGGTLASREFIAMSLLTEGVELWVAVLPESDGVPSVLLRARCSQLSLLITEAAVLLGKTAMTGCENAYPNRRQM